MDKAEAKFANTAKKMDAALLSLLEEKPFDAITVTDVCKAADVHRSTFYSHYSNTLDLLDEVKDAVLDEFYARFDHLPKEVSGLNREYLKIYLKFVEEHKRVFKVFLENLNLFDGRGILMRLEGDLAEASSSKGMGKDELASYKLLYTASGITSIVSHWLEAGCKESREELVNIILACAKG